MTNFLTFLLLSTFLILSVHAETHHVNVADNVFIPQNINIQAGDTVRWKNLGLMNHNVASSDIDFIFRCAMGCDDTGGDGNPAGPEWVSEVTFHQPSNTIPYICEPHVGFGMAGSVSISTPEPDQIIIVDMDNGFSPQVVDVGLGSRIQFINQGGEHNIRADDDRFQCSESCRDDGIQGNYSPSGFLWSLYMIFDEVGTVNYHCQTPGHNETATIHVIDYPIFINGFEFNP